MAISDKLQEVYDNVSLVYAAGLSNGRAESWLYYATSLDNIFGGTIFPVGSAITLRVKQAPVKSTFIFNNCQGVKRIKLISDEEQTSAIDMTNAFFVASSTSVPKTLEIVDLSEYCRILKNTGSATNINMFGYQTKLRTIVGDLDLTLITNTNNMFAQCGSLVDVGFVPNTIRCSIKFNQCPSLSKASLVSIINGLADDVTGFGVQFNQAAINANFTAQEWADLIAPKTNWTFTYV